MPSNKPGSRLIRAAGGVAWRPGPDGRPQVLLVHRRKYDDWSLPKGKMEPGEPLPVTAVREVLEEGGARLALGRRLTSVRYNVGGRPKRVHYWAARVLSVDSRAIPNAEVDQVAWLPADRAVEKVSYPHDHGVLADFAARPPQTFPLILLRHAKALPKGGWKRPDADRPLDDSGRYAAKALADLLACFSPSFQLVTSPAARCTDTLRPLSELTGDPVREEPALYVHYQPAPGEADPGTVNAALIRAAIESGKPTVVCAHRENMASLRQAALAVLTGYSSAGQSPAVKAPGGPAVKAPGGPAVKAPGGPAVKAPGGPAVKAPGGTAVKAPGGPAVKAPASTAVKAPAGRASRGDKAADGGAAVSFGLPRDWDETLPPSGFWVLNIAPFPEAAEAGSKQAAEPDTAEPAAPAQRPTWWQRLRALARRGDAAGRPDDARGDLGGQAGGTSRQSPATAGAGDGVPEGEAGASRGDAPAGGAAARRPVGVLISADRYDLSELDES